MANKNPASYQKRQRELDKKRKADDKRKRRLEQKQMPADQVSRPFIRDDDKQDSTD